VIDGGTMAAAEGAVGRWEKGGRDGDRGAPPARPGDWACPSCQAICFASKTACFKCGEPKPAGAGGGGAGRGERGHYGDRNGGRGDRRGGGGGGGGGSRGGGGGGRDRPSARDAGDLDAELEAYNSKRRASDKGADGERRDQPTYSDSE
jgi:hypothetical protein